MCFHYTGVYLVYLLAFAIVSLIRIVLPSTLNNLNEEIYETQKP